MPNLHADSFELEIPGEIPSFKLLETDLTYVFLDIGPIAPYHTLIIPKFHTERMDELEDKYLGDILPIAKKVAKAIGCKDYNILQNNGKIAHQHVFHVHFHVIPKPSEEEGLGVGWPRVEPGLEVLSAVHKDLATKFESQT